MEERYRGEDELEKDRKGRRVAIWTLTATVVVAAIGGLIGYEMKGTVPSVLVGAMVAAALGCIVTIVVLPLYEGVKGVRKTK